MKAHKGFTVLELLVASLIIIAVIALSHVAFSQYIQILSKTESFQKIGIAVIEAQKQIDLNEDVSSLDGNIEMGALKVSWKGEVIDSFLSSTYDAEQGVRIDGSERYFLVLFVIELERNGIKLNQTFNYHRIFVLNEG